MVLAFWPNLDQFGVIRQNLDEMSYSTKCRRLLNAVSTKCRIQQDVVSMKYNSTKCHGSVLE